MHAYMYGVYGASILHKAQCMYMHKAQWLYAYMCT